MSIWTEFSPLESCVIGTLPEPSEIIQHTNLTGRYRKYFEDIIKIGRNELNHLEHVLKDLGVITHRSKQSYPMHNGKTINTPPLAVRDIYTVYGNHLYKGNLAFEWNKQVPNCCDHILKDIPFDKEFILPTNNRYYDGDFENFDPEKDLKRPMYHPPISLRCGEDIIMAKHLGKQGNRSGEKEYMNWIKSINPKARFHVVDTDSHIDSQLFLVRPGLLLTSLPDSCLPDYFDKWEKIFVEPVTTQLFHKRNKHRHKKFHPVIARVFYNFLETCTEETYFNLNSLSVDENTIIFTGVHATLFSKLEKKGIECIPISMKATTFWDMGIHCVTNELSRKGMLEDYR